MLVLHNITPHLHLESLGEAQQSSTSDTSGSLLNWLASTFQSDLGEGHLECFSEVSDLDVSDDDEWLRALDWQASVQYELILKTDHSGQIRNTFSIGKLSPHYYNSGAPLRAPPSLV